MNPLSTEQKLSVDKIHVNEARAHIRINCDFPDREHLKKLMLACPAGLYKLNEQNTLTFDYAGCLECGTCRVLSMSRFITDWDYPEGGFGIVYRQG
ncbi:MULTISPECIES: 4Fe-4S dicluster domain-containing protein [unclassified Sporolactobacillus]|uniref:4Fe-4S dicluster domain-containing protein n=1 Tax=unclassified Sporolactobacillus TaxID=2628533 RepID=UPI002368E06A|nr:4Fe-4S dicluster domain-containing protein [Sporolactobacillus sp. CQH2019]MDD9146955.1 4Fe-4S dicluster domain-containing protein [Sporolactobacillus sp. CQH2019]